MKRILLLVEGQTEEQFVKKILNPAFNPKGLYLIPTIITTKIVKNGPNFKGGITSYNTIKKDTKRLLADSDTVAVTTMLDYYGLPSDFPTSNKEGTCYDKVEATEAAFSKDMDHEKFIPYIQLHEFEGLLFSSPKIISDTFNGTNGRELEAIRKGVKSPEEINHGPNTHPSKRLLNIFPHYNKPVYGSLIATRTGLENMRIACPHFNKWIIKLETLTK